MVNILGKADPDELPKWIKKPKDTRALIVIRIDDDNIASMFIDLSYVDDDDETRGNREALRILDDAAQVIAQSHFESTD